MNTLDNIIALRTSLQWRRVILKIDEEGNEYEVLAGAQRLFATGNVVAVIWENGEHNEPAVLNERRKAILALLNSFGFAHYRFDREKERLTPLPTLDPACYVYSLSPDFRAESSER